MRRARSTEDTREVHGKFYKDGIEIRGLSVTSGSSDAEGNIETEEQLKS